MIEIDGMAGASYGLASCLTNRFSSEVWQEDCADDAVYSAVLTDHVRLGAELDCEFRRLRSRLSA
jgi:hypothetical protein